MLEELDLYPIPNFSNYKITKDGRVFNLTTEKELSGSFNPAGYLNFRLKRDDDKTFTIGRHRLLAIVFLHPNKDISNLHVNHEDGIKGNDTLDNLTWVTVNGNIEHAGLMGLTTKCVPISVRDFKTKKVFKFPSYTKCANALGISKDAVSYRASVGEKRIFPDNRQYRKGWSDDPWYEPKDVNLSLLENGLTKVLLARNVYTNEVLEFDKITDFSDHIHVSPSTVTGWLKRFHPVVMGGYQIKLKNDTRSWRPIVNLEKEIRATVPGKKILVTDNETGEVKRYNSLASCAMDLNIKVTTLCGRLKSNGSKVYSDGFKFQYESN